MLQTEWDDKYGCVTATVTVSALFAVFVLEVKKKNQVKPKPMTSNAGVDFK